MTEIALRLKDELLKLPPKERFDLARAVWDSLDDEMLEQFDDAEWGAELERRAAATDAGMEAEQPFREAIDELRKEMP